jgi:hypothetical protein
MPRQFLHYAMIIEFSEGLEKSYLVEAAGIEPASKGCDQKNLHV